MDVSSEIIHALLPVFLTAGLGVSVAMVGLIDGVAESTAAITKVFSGYVSDRTRRRKPLILFGYALGALSKPLFAVSASAGLVLVARIADRIGKGLRGAPRDALIADVTPPEIRGRAYGLRQALDTAGAFVGPLLAIVLMMLFNDDFHAVFWIAIIPALLAVLCVLVGVEDRKSEDPAMPPIRMADLKRLPAAFWIVVGIGGVLTLARFSEAFLILKASEEGLPLAFAPAVLVVLNIVYSAGAFPAGMFADRVKASTLLLSGIVLLIGADLVIALGDGLPWTFAGVALWGAHMALTQGLLAKLVAEHAPEALRATGFGVFNLAVGGALLVASILAGALWEFAGAKATFLAGAGFAAFAAAGVAIALKEVR